MHTALTSCTNTFWGDSAPGGGLLAEVWSGDPDTEAREPLSVTQHGASEGDMGALLPPNPQRASSAESRLLNVVCSAFRTGRSSVQTEMSVP